MLDPTQRFSDRVENYVRYRPGYPPALIRCLQERAGLGGHHTVADIGSGTGILTALLLPVAACVYAVEPNAAMRAAAERDLGSAPNFVSLAGTAEATGLPAGDVDLVTAGQAFHWFEPTSARREFARILKPGGHVALVWNERLPDATPFLAAYEKLLREQASAYPKVDHTRIDAAAFAAFFSPATYESFSFPNAQSFDWEGLAGRAQSSSYVPNVGQPGHPDFMAELQRIFLAHSAEGRVSFLYATKLYLARFD